MIGIVGIKGKMGSYFKGLLNEVEIIGFDKEEDKQNKIYNNMNDFFDNKLKLVIDFSNSQLSKYILVEAINRKIKVISGTSNIPNIDYIANLAYRNKVSFVYLENFSKGINYLTKILSDIECENIEIIEEHNKNKKDISQTAITLANLLTTNNISSIRTIKKESNHYIKFYYEGEEISIIHKCLNYSAYKEVFLYEYKQILSSNFYYKYGIIEQS